MQWFKHALLGLFGIIGLTVSMFGLFKVPFAESAAKEYWRQALVAILLILGLIAGIIALFIYTFDANNFKSEIIQYVKVHKQRDLTLEGDIRVTFFPKLGLNSGKMALSERNSSKGFASIDNARLYVAWLPLLRKQLEVDRITLEGVHANVIRYKDGSSNLDDLLIRDSSLESTRFDIDSVSISNTSVDFRDESEGLHFSLQDLHLETGRLTDSVPSNLNATFRLEANRPLINTNARLSSHLFFERNTGHFELANFEGSMEGEAGGISKLALNFEGTLNGFPALGSMTMDKLVISARGQLNAHNLDARLEVPKLQLNRDKLSGNKLKLTSSLTHAEENLSAILQAPAFDLASRSLQCAECTLDLDLKQTDRRLQARLSSPVNANLEKRQWLLPTLSGKFTLNHPDFAMPIEGKATGQASADWLEQEFKTSLEATLADSQMAITLGMKNFSQPAYTLDLGINQLDLDRLLVADWSSRLLADNAVTDWSLLKSLKLRGSVRVDELKFARLKLHKLMLELMADQASIQADPVNAELYGGTLSGSAKLTVQDTARLSLKQKLTGIQTQHLLEDATGASRVTGKGTATLSLSGEGNNFASLRRSLAGNATLMLNRGSLAGIQLGKALSEGKPWLGVPDGERSHVAAAGDSTDFSELKSELEIGNGVLLSRELSVKSALFVSKGTGSLNLDSCTLDYQLETEVSPSLKRQAHGELADLRGVTVPTRLGGNCTSPALSLNFTVATGGNAARLGKTNLARVAASNEAAAKK